MQQPTNGIFSDEFWNIREAVWSIDLSLALDSDRFYTMEGTKEMDNLEEERFLVT